MAASPRSRSPLSYTADRTTLEIARGVRSGSDLVVLAGHFQGCYIYICCLTRKVPDDCLWHKWLRHLLPVEPTCDIVLPPDRPLLPPRQNSAARRLRRQTPRRRAGACIFSEHRRRTPNARTEETVRATDSGAYPTVGRRRSDLLPGAGRCGRSRQKKKYKKIRKNVVTIDRP